MSKTKNAAESTWAKIQSVTFDDARERGVVDWEPLREKNLCPLVIVRARDAGVHIGKLAACNDHSVTLLDAHRLYSWSGKSHTLNEVALEGIPKGRISAPVPQIVIFHHCEILPILPAAAKSLTTPSWEE